MITVRPYRESDRDQVRSIAFETGYMGESAAWFWRDSASFSEIWTGYYTDREPESAFVAADGACVVGYLLGCVETADAPTPRSAMINQFLRRQLFLRPGTAGFFWRSVWDTLRSPRLPSGEISDPRWPAHLHIDLLPGARGCGAAYDLMDAWLTRLRKLGSAGCHLGTMWENRRAIDFFERVGFRRYGPPLLLPGMRTRSGERMHEQVMVMSLAPGEPAD